MSYKHHNHHYRSRHKNDYIHHTSKAYEDSKIRERGCFIGLMIGIFIGVLAGSITVGIGCGIAGLVIGYIIGSIAVLFN